MDEKSSKYAFKNAYENVVIGMLQNMNFFKYALKIESKLKKKY